MLKRYSCIRLFLFSILEHHVTNDTISDSLDYPVLRILLLMEGVLAILSLFINSSVIFIFLRMLAYQRHKRSNIIFLWQAVTDLIVTIAMVVDVIFYSSFYNSILMPPQFFVVWWFFFGYSQILAINTLLLITIERLMAIRYPLHHRFYSTRTKTASALCTTYSISTIPAIVYTTYIWPLFMTFYDKFHFLAMQYVIIISTLSLMILIVIFVFLIVSYSSIRKSIQKRIRQHYRYVSINKQIKRFIRREQIKHRRIIRILIIVCTIYSVTYLPLTIYRICYYPLYDVIPESLHMVLYNSFVLLYFSSALLNPIVTLCFNLDYRKRLLQCFCNDYKNKTEYRQKIKLRLTSEIETLLKRSSNETRL